MPWGAAAGAAIGLIGNAMQDDKNGGAGASSTSKEPWMMATPWLANNLLLGQQMQQGYLDQPISAKQQQATNNQYALSDYMRQEIPSLLGQMQAQPLGYDKANPNARAKAFDWSLLGGGGGAGAGAGGANPLGQGSVGGVQDVARPVRQPDKPAFSNQADMLTGANMTGLTGSRGDGSALYGAGQYGAFRYGMPMPQPGTQAYRDMSEYFAYGGQDPNNLYGRGGQAGGGFGGMLIGGPGVSVGDGVGVAGSAASVGSSANF